MAFHFFLSLVPVLVLIGFVLGQVVRQRGVDALLGPAIETAPDAVEQIVREELARMAGASASSIAPLSVLGFLWLAATGTHGLMDAFEVAAGAARRAWWKKRVIALIWVASTLVALAVLGWGMIRIDEIVPQGVRRSRRLTGALGERERERPPPMRLRPLHAAPPLRGRRPRRWRSARVARQARSPSPEPALPGGVGAGRHPRRLGARRAERAGRVLSLRGPAPGGALNAARGPGRSSPSRRGSSCRGASASTWSLRWTATRSSMGAWRPWLSSWCGFT